MNESVVLGHPGVVAPGAHSIQDIGRSFVSHDSVLNITTIPAPWGMNPRQLRRLSRSTKCAMYAAQVAYTHAPLTSGDGALFIAMTHGATSFLQEFHDYMFDYGLDMASPNAFSNGVTNASLGAISMMLSMRGGGMSLVGYENAGLEAINHAARAIATRQYPMCLVGGAEEYSPLVVEVYQRFGLFCGRKMPAWLPQPPEPENNSAHIPISEGSVFFSVAPVSVSNGDHPRCIYTPIDDPLGLDMPVDVIISGAGGGPQDSGECIVLEKQLGRGRKPAVLFSKPYCGELFGVGPLVSVALARDILLNSTPYKPYPLEPSLQKMAAADINFSTVRSVLVTAAARDGDISAGLLHLDV